MKKKKTSSKKKRGSVKKSSTKKVKKKVRAKSVKKRSSLRKSSSKKVSKASKSRSVTRTKEKLVGKVTHYFDKIKVAAVKLSSGLKIGESIRIKGGENTDFTQKVTSMEIRHKKVKRAKKGEEIGLKVKEKVREGYKVYKV